MFILYSWDPCVLSWDLQILSLTNQSQHKAKSCITKPTSTLWTLGTYLVWCRKKLVMLKMPTLACSRWKSYVQPCTQPWNPPLLALHIAGMLNTYVSLWRQRVNLLASGWGPWKCVDISQAEHYSGAALLGTLRIHYFQNVKCWKMNDVFQL